MSFSAIPVGDYDWDHEETAAAYEIFSARHDRYRVANRALVENAYVENSLHILDFAAGMGATTQALLSEIHPEARVVCVEPSDTMRSRGRNQVQDYRVSWQDGLPDAVMTISTASFVAPLSGNCCLCIASSNNSVAC